jgi:hypothetical protein
MVYIKRALEAAGAGQGSAADITDISGLTTPQPYVSEDMAYVERLINETWQIANVFAPEPVPELKRGAPMPVEQIITGALKMIAGNDGADEKPYNGILNRERIARSLTDIARRVLHTETVAINDFGGTATRITAPYLDAPTVTKPFPAPALGTHAQDTGLKTKGW